jgi:hypothetical protein
MTHRVIALLVTLTLANLVAPLAAAAQVLTPVPRIGVLVLGSPPTFSTGVETFRQGLRNGMSANPLHGFERFILQNGQEQQCGASRPFSLH